MSFLKSPVPYSFAIGPIAPVKPHELLTLKLRHFEIAQSSGPDQLDESLINGHNQLLISNRCSTPGSWRMLSH